MCSVFFQTLISQWATNACVETVGFWSNSVEEFSSAVREAWVQFPANAKAALLSFPGGAGGKESTCRCRRHRRCRLSLWVRRIPWSQKSQSTPVFLPGKFPGQRSLAGYGPWGCEKVRHDLTKQQQQYSMEYSFLIFISIED